MPVADATVAGQLPVTKEYILRDFISCNTEGVVYALQCPCGMMYIGRTKRAMHLRIKEHVYQIVKGKTEEYLYQHFRTVHNRKTLGMTFWGIEKYMKHWRGSHCIRTLSHRESWWVYYLGRGFNREFDLNCFLANF